MVSIKSWVKNQIGPSTSAVVPLEFTEVEKEVVINGEPIVYKVKVYKTVVGQCQNLSFSKEAGFIAKAKVVINP